MHSKLTPPDASTANSMNRSERLRSPWAWVIAVALPILLGLLVPAYYEWTGSDQSRVPRVVPITMFAILGTALAATVAVPWLIPSRAISVAEVPQTQRFTLRALLLSVTAAAVAMGVFRSNPLMALGALFVVGVWGVLVRYAWRNPTLGWPVSAMFGCLYGPMTWVFTYGDLHIPLFESLALFVGLPPFLAVDFLGTLFQSHFDKSFWISHLATGLQLLLGAWLARSYPRIFIIFLLWSFVLAIIGSFGLNALVRM